MLLTFYSDPTQPSSQGYIISSILFGLLLIRAFFYSHGQNNIFYDITLNYSSFYGAIYKKVLRMRETVKGQIGAGRIVNFISTDSTLIAEALNLFQNVWPLPISLIIACVLLYLEVQWCAFVGLGLILLLASIQCMVMNSFVRNKIANQVETDNRTKLLQEFLEGIRIIKYYAWERFAYSKIEEVRIREIGQMEYGLLMRTIHEFIMNAIPIVSMIVVFSVYSIAIGTLTVPKVFTIVSVFGVLRPPLALFITSIINLAQTKASIDRVTKFFDIVASYEVIA